MWKCLYLPWHKLRINKKYKELEGYQVKCSCGKLYAMHDGVRTILDWDESFERLYRDCTVIKHQQKENVDHE